MLLRLEFQKRRTFPAQIRIKAFLPSVCCHAQCSWRVDTFRHVKVWINTSKILSKRRNMNTWPTFWGLTWVIMSDYGWTGQHLKRRRLYLTRDTTWDCTCICRALLAPYWKMFRIYERPQNKGNTKHKKQKSAKIFKRGRHCFWSKTHGHMFITCIHSS